MSCWIFEHKWCLPSCLFLFCLVLSFSVLPWLVFFYPVLSCLFLFCLVLSFSVLSCLFLSCLVFFYPVLSCLILFCLVLCCLVLSCSISSSLLSFPVSFFSHRLLLNWIANSMHLLMDQKQLERRQQQQMVKVTSNNVYDIIQSGNRSRVNVFRSRLRHRRFAICIMRAGRKMRMTK